MRVAEAITISAPAEQVWAIVSDPERVLEFMSGVTRWEVASPNPTGLGALPGAVPDRLGRDRRTDRGG